jgi:hypothetical protein
LRIVPGIDLEIHPWEERLGIRGYGSEIERMCLESCGEVDCDVRAEASERPPFREEFIGPSQRSEVSEEVQCPDVALISQ